LVRLNLTNSNQRTGLKKICNESLLIGRTLWRHHMMSRLNMNDR
jgi:hypothetical protein